MTSAFLFPGQGSQALHLMQGFTANDVVLDTFAEAHQTIGVNLWEMLTDDSPSRINQTYNTQLLMLTVNIAIYRLWLQHHCVPAYFAGHSLGEYAALVAAGVIDFQQALHIVALRAEFMQAAASGSMLAILGLTDETVIKLCSEYTTLTEPVEAANFNAPKQVVIAGTNHAVAIVAVAAQNMGAKTITLPVSVPSHCSLMLPAAAKLTAILQDYTFNDAKIPVCQNFSATLVQDATELKQQLIQQLSSPVLWSQSIIRLITAGVTDFVESAPGGILKRLNKRIAPNIPTLCLNSAADIY
jgi:[acyl-carrier-protein] S-malonyltransferase